MCVCVCFPYGAEVWTLETGSHLIPELKSYSEILSVNLTTFQLKKTKFITYLHYNKDVIGEFLSIETDGNELMISKEHHIFVGKSKIPIPAKNLAIGQSIWKVFQNVEEKDTDEAEEYYLKEVTVTNIQEKKSQGIFAPLTNSGTLIVNGFLVSCYAHVKSHQFAHRILAPLRFYYSRRRKKLMLDESGNKSLDSLVKHRDADGIHKFAKALLSIAKLLPNFAIRQSIDPILISVKI